MRASGLAVAAALFAAAPAANADIGAGYPNRGTALSQLSAATDYNDVLSGRPLALGIMRARAQGFVPSRELQTYVQSVMVRLLADVKMPPSFHPQVRVLAAPEFTGECTPDGTLIITVGLLEQIENEDELAFVLGHELAHAIYKHQAKNWFKKAQYYAVVSGGAEDAIAQSAAAAIGGSAGANVLRGLDVAKHLAKLSSNVLMPQMEREQEDAADALGYDLIVKAGYDPEAALSVMDKLAEQEAEAATAAAQARAAAQKDSESGGSKLTEGLTLGMGALGSILSGSAPSTGQMADIAIFAFDTAVDNMAEDATAHHPAKERQDLLSAYAFREYRNAAMVNPTPLPWSVASKSPLKPQLTLLLSHYALAENAAAYVADHTQGNPGAVKVYVASSTSNPTADHAYTEFVAAEYYTLARQDVQSELALVRAAGGPEPSWEVYSRLADLYMQRGEYGKAQELMDHAVSRFENSPVLLPKRIAVLRGAGRQPEADALVPQCRKYDIDELTDACKKAAGQG
ncbi:MAG: M48 family metallopeptidase [Alphaproteobacteria bacterium]|nr:M48 family metallopeptidase [Alphaproteobacteria bacterium]